MACDRAAANEFLSFIAGEVARTIADLAPSDPIRLGDYEYGYGGIRGGSQDLGVS